MVLAFDSTGNFGKAVYGDASSQHAGQNGAISTSNPSTTMKGGRNRSRRNSRRNQNGNRNQNGGRNSRRQRQSRRQQRSRRQRGGK